MYQTLKNIYNQNLVIELKNINTIEHIFNLNIVRVIVIKIYANWCPISKEIENKYIYIANKFSHKYIKFFEDNIENTYSVFGKKNKYYNCDVTPTFLILTDNELIPRKIIKGNINELSILIEKIYNRLNNT
tara:strand:+ start:1876 stop:2268 length:393 start_codon:yes stop_codon:yes gene_type:complete